MKKLNLIKATGLGIILSSAMYVSAAEVSKEIELDLNASTDLILIQNLAGKIKVNPSSDNEVHIRGTVTATADNQKEAEALLKSIQFDTEDNKNSTVISVKYPINDYSGFIYNPNNERSSWGNWSSSSYYMGKKVKVASKPKGLLAKWAEVHTDLSIELPVEQYSKVKLVSGAIEAQDLNNDITLDTSSGKIRITDSEGKVNADTGSGSVIIENFSGFVKADTGSGSISITNANGDVDADTGSGSIKINKVTGDVKADTGSGSVTVNDYLGGEKLEIDTGSGSVRVNGDLGNINDLEVDTGSGSVKLVSTHAPSLKIDIDTGSGGVNVDLPNLNVRKDKGGEFIGTAGEGRGTASIDTGSGSVSFRMDSDYKSNSVQKTVKVKESTTQKGNNPELAAKVRAALSQDKDLRKANFDVNAKGDKVFVSGTVESVWDLPKAIKIINEVDGVEDISIDIDTDD